MSAKALIANITSGKGADGRVTALRNASELLQGHLTVEEFDATVAFIEKAQQDESINARRREFNDEYLKTVKALHNLEFANINA